MIHCDSQVSVEIGLYENEEPWENKRSRTRRDLNKRGKFILILYFTFSTMALKASGWFMAKSARTFLLSSIPLDFTFPIN